MPGSDVERQIVVVSGDVTIDWNLAEENPRAGSSLVWNRDLRTSINLQPGGAYLLARLIRQVIDGIDVRSFASVSDSESGYSQGWLREGDPRHHHQSTAVWTRYGKGTMSGETVWRVRGFQGFMPRDVGSPLSEELTRIHDDPEQPDTIVIDDANLGFRDRDNEALWPRAIREPRNPRPWVILKTAVPVAEGALTDHLLEQFADRLIVVTTAADIRRSDGQISSGLSWEASAEDLTWELAYNPKINKLAGARALAVSFGPAGVWLSRHSRRNDVHVLSSTSTLVFDHNVVEVLWDQENVGGMIGYTTCLAAAITKALIVSPEDPDLSYGARIGLAAMQALHEIGYLDPEDRQHGSRIAFPLDVIKRSVSADPHESESLPFGTARVPMPRRSLTVAGSEPAGATSGRWSILEDRYTTKSQLMADAEAIVRRGAERVLTGVPLGRFGDLLTADRQEIEGFRAIRNLIDQYCSDQRQRNPLSVAVFGPPGSGKSFGVTQVAKSLRADEIEPLTLNLSQFDGPDDLVNALHQVRDHGLSGKVPLVFWDEFDTSLDGKPLGWLRHFLAPMQDGEFQDEQVTHPIGRAIFVFAGGTAQRLDEFTQTTAQGPGESPEDATKRLARWKEAKGPDFVSRLKGYINIVGPDRQSSDHADTSDPQYVIRRAIILRSILARQFPEITHEHADGTLELLIDPGLLRAFLTVWRFKHGARSMESIVAMSQLHGKVSFQRSSLPSLEQLDVHVDGREFLGLLVQQIHFEGDLLERLARAHHELYCEQERRKPNPSPLASKSWRELDASEVESNLDAVRSIPYKLASIGYSYRPGATPDRIMPLEIPDEKVDAIGRAEHDRWIIEKVDQGWVYGPEKQDKVEPKTHPDLVPWDALDDRELAARYPPQIRSKLGPGPLKNPADRELIKSIPHVLAKAGLELARVEHAERFDGPLD